MSDYSTNATVNLNVNGKEAKQMLGELKQRAHDLQNAMAKAAAAGNKVELTKLRKELKSTQKEIKQIESATLEVENVMRRLDSATPKELQATLRSLQKDLNKLERGSEAWKAHTAKIQQVKAELAKVNEELRLQESFWTRLNRKMNEWQTAIMGAAAAITGLTMAGRAAVNKFAEMDEELANTSKYTGMSRKEVDKLNEAFKRMDTRTSREQLNELAQEAGRLGKNTLEDVQGYVEAADIINVALVDLGAGATQTIAKLSNIFGVEKVMSTKEAMLSVGSAVNVLSQNCTASKTYLVEFAQRMAGIGAQADMTIPEILAFGATLDANGQKTEMSSSALGKLIMMLNQKPDELSKAVGLNTKELKELLKTDTTGAVIKFLEQIQKMGSKDGLAVLAPLFKDMGMDGVRMSQVLATLAEHLDMVKWEVGEANKAFKEASSATHEYNIFNNTAQAGLDKAKKRIQELAIELGEKLLPIMRHVYSSTSIFLRLLSGLVTFFIEYKEEIITLTTAYLGYKLAVEASTIAFKVHYAWVVIVEKAQKIWAATIATVKGAVLLLRIAMAKLEGNYARVKLLQTELNAAMKANYIGAIIAAVVLLTGALIKLIKKMGELSATEKMLNEVQVEGRKNAQEQIDYINTLREAAKNEALAEQDRLRACEKLNAISPSFCANIDKVTGKYSESTKAVTDYVNALIRQYEIEGAKDKLAEIGKQRAELKGKLRQAEKVVEQDEKLAKGNVIVSGREGKMMETGTAAVNLSHRKAVADIKDQLHQLDEDENALKDLYGNDIQLSVVKAPTPAHFVTEGSGGAGGGGGTGGGDTDTNSGSTTHEDKFAKEKEWKEREEALNRIAFAKGENNYEAYVKRMEEISIEFYKKELEHTDLSENERLTIQADYYEAIKKQTDSKNKRTIEQEEAAYAESLATEKQRYVDGKVELSAYEGACELLELQHLRAMVAITKGMGDEHAKASKAYLDKMVEYQKKKQKEAEELEKKHQEELRKIEEQSKKIKDEYFGNNAAENKALYDAEIEMLNQIYATEIELAKDNAEEKLRIEKAYEDAKLAIAKKYNQLREVDERSAVHRMVDSSVEWLNSDGGKALTGTMDALVSGMSACFSQLTSIVQAEMEIQSAAIGKKYDAQISAAEGNNYKIKRLEEQRAKEEAKAKKEANRKMFAMQVIQAVAQTAQGAIAAYASAAAIPITGWIMAPIAASLAIAAGTLQIAAIKKQQQASEATGYSKGGFTPKGRVDEEVGVVHAGEWVASQKLLANPKARALINTLDYAQRTNTIGSLDAADVSRSITAPSIIARSADDDSIANSLNAQAFAIASYTATMKKLQQRLDEPFVTINTVTGDAGINKAQSDYEKLMKNKAPKR